MTLPKSWTKTLPTAAGWYCWRYRRGDRPKWVRVYRRQYETVFWADFGPHGVDSPVTEVHGEWAGPFTLPAEKCDESE
jgi:hypothetical protein